MRHLSLVFFGGFHAAIDGRTIQGFGADKARALLAYLAIENNRAHRRSALAGLFWSDLPETKAAHNLSQTLLRLRNALEDRNASEPFLLANSQDIRLNPRASIQSDVSMFTDLLKTCQQHHRGDSAGASGCSDCIGWLLNAVELYRGELLAGFYVPDSESFEQWRLTQKETLEMRAIDVLEVLANYHERRGLYDQVLKFAHQLTKLDPWCEDAHLQIMRALTAKGQSASAVEHYDIYCRMLMEELGIEPSQHATETYQQIRLSGSISLAGETTVHAGLPFASQAEVRQITALVCSRSTANLHADPEALYHQMLHCRQTCEKILKQFGGHSSQRQGTDCLIYYGYPLAYEDSARRAVLAGLAMAGSDKEDPVRVGVHTGWMVIDEKRGRRSQDRELIGDPPNTARAVQNLALPGSVVISEDTERLVRGHFDCQPVERPVPLDGSSELRAYDVSGESSMLDPFDLQAAESQLSPFTGREQAMERLVSALHRAARGKGQVVLVRGEQGIGKSRLVWELKNYLRKAWPPAEGGPLWLEAHCTPYDQTKSFTPLTQIIEQLLGIHPKDNATTRDAKRTTGFIAEFLEDPETVRLITMLLEISHDTAAIQPTAQIRELMHSAAVRFLKKRAAAQPLVLVAEDMQWSDTDTIYWISHAFSLLENAPVLILLTARSGFQPPWLEKKAVTRLDLSPLAPAQSEALASQIAGESLLAPGRLRNILARADGIPLYIESLSRCSKPDDPGSQPKDLPELVDLPAALRDIFAAQLDSLGPARITAQWGAVIGRQFSLRILHAASNIPLDRLRHDLQAMQTARIITPLDPPPHGVYSFRLALIREAACASLLNSTRREYRRRAIEAVEHSTTTDYTRPQI